MYKCVLMCRTDNTGSPDQEKKLMVFRSNLLELFKSCPLCCADTIGVITNEEGTAVSVAHQCSNCGYCKIWRNQPYVRNMPVANLLVSGAIIASGCMPAKAMRLFKLLGLNTISSSTFFRHQRLYVQPIIYRMWRNHQNNLLSTLKNMNGGLQLAADGRSDSPGHCAKFGNFTVMEMRTNKVLNIEIVQVGLFRYILTNFTYFSRENLLMI